MRLQVVRGLVLVLVFTAGCAPASGDGDRGTVAAEPEYPAAQSWALNDGTVTDDEYKTAISQFVMCVTDAGYRVTDPVLSPVDGLTLLYDLTPQGDPDRWNEKMESCNVTYVSHIEPTYVEARQQVMDPSLRDRTGQCLRDKGFILSGTESNVEQFRDSTGGSNTVMECVSASLKELFPTVPGFLRVRW